MHVYLTTQPIARSLLSCSVRLFVTLCDVDVSKRPILLSNFFIASWPHHFSFPKGDPTVKFRRDHPQQGRQIEVGYTKNLLFSTSISEIPIPIPNTEVFQNTDTEYRTDMKKIPTKIPNTDTDFKYRYRPSSSTESVKAVQLKSSGQSVAGPAGRNREFPFKK